MEGAVNGWTNQKISAHEPTDFLLNNRDFFRGYKFNFEGLDTETKEGFIEVVQDLGAYVCDDADYILVEESYPSLVKGPKRHKLYHLAYILDSIEAKKPLDISKYSFFKYAYNLFSKTTKAAPSERREEINGILSNQPSAPIVGQMIKSEGSDDYKGPLRNLNSVDAEFFDNMNEIQERMRAAGKLREFSVEKRSDFISGEESLSDEENDSYSIDSGTYGEKNEKPSDRSTLKKSNNQMRVKSVDSINYGCSEERTKFADKIIEESSNDSSDDLSNVKQIDNNGTLKSHQKSSSVRSQLTLDKTEKCKIRKRLDSNSSSDNQAPFVKGPHLRKKKLKTDEIMENTTQSCSSRINEIILSSSASDQDEGWMQKNVEENQNSKVKQPFIKGNTENNQPCTSKGKVSAIADKDSEGSTNELSMDSDSGQEEQEKQDVHEPANRDQWWRRPPRDQVISNPCENPRCLLEPRPHRFHSNPGRVLSLLERRILIRYFVMTDQIASAKGTKIYQEMHQDGYLRNRTCESLRNNFRRVILPNIEEYGLPKKLERQFRALRR